MGESRGQLLPDQRQNYIDCYAKLGGYHIEIELYYCTAIVCPFANSFAQRLHHSQVINSCEYTLSPSDIFQKQSNQLRSTHFELISLMQPTIRFELET